jgi:hypothetical protein
MLLPLMCRNKAYSGNAGSGKSGSCVVKLTALTAKNIDF